MTTETCFEESGILTADELTRYAGGETWPDDVPRTGKSAETGCVGCFWYDMSAWRDALNKLIRAMK